MSSEECQVQLSLKNVTSASVFFFFFGKKQATNKTIKDRITEARTATRPWVLSSNQIQVDRTRISYNLFFFFKKNVNFQITKFKLVLARHLNTWKMSPIQKLAYYRDGQKKFSLKKCFFFTFAKTIFFFSKHFYNIVSKNLIKIYLIFNSNMPPFWYLTFFKHFDV